MNKLTISQARLTLAEIEKTYRLKLKELSLSSSATVTHIQENDGVKHHCSEAYEFDKAKEEVVKLSKQIEVLKNEIAKANNSTFVEVDGNQYTIQECLNKLKINRDELKVYDDILYYNRPSKIRKVDAAGTQAYYQVTELTFDKESLKNFADSMRDSILKFELAVNEANNKIVITVA